MRDAKKRPDTCIKGMARCRASPLGFKSSVGILSY